MRGSFALLVVSSLVSACADDGHGEEPVDCVKETSDDDFVIGLSKTGDNGLYTFALTSFSPAPPARLLNEWTMTITPTASAAVPTTEVLAMTPYMPQHGHGAGVDVEISPMPAAGEFKFSTINLHMPGIWEVTVEVTGASYDSVKFIPCIPE